MANILLYNTIFERIANVLHGNRQRYHRKRKLAQVTIGANSTLADESTINNFQYSKEKICIGKNTFLRGELMVFAHQGLIEIGDDCYIGENSKIWSASRISIGNQVLISHNVNIHDNNSHPTDSKERAWHYNQILKSGHPREGLDIKGKEIIIKNNVWIGFNSIILKGVTLGEGCIVAAGSVVTRSVPAFAIVVGNPATVVKYVQ